MSGWSNSNRRDRLPAQWDKIRKNILIRDNYRCQARLEDGFRCMDLANEVDHIVAGDNHDPSNLQAICTWHHAKKSAREGNAARAKVRREISSRFRRREEHPAFRA